MANEMDCRVLRKRKLFKNRFAVRPLAVHPLALIPPPLQNIFVGSKAFEMFAITTTPFAYHFRSGKLVKLDRVFSTPTVDGHNSVESVAESRNCTMGGCAFERWTHQRSVDPARECGLRGDVVRPRLRGNIRVLDDQQHGAHRNGGVDRSHCRWHGERHALSSR